MTTFQILLSLRNTVNTGSTKFMLKFIKKLVHKQMIQTAKIKILVHLFLQNNSKLMKWTINSFNIQIMFNNFIKNINTSLESIPIISAIQYNQSGSQGGSKIVDQSLDIEKVIQEVISNLTNILSERLGEKVQSGQFKDIGADMLKSKALQSHLIETKEKFNELVNKSTNLYQNARKISNSIGQFITSINLFLESQELLVPLKQIQRGINDMQPDKVDKQVNYLIKIFENNFQEVIDKRVRTAESNLHQELKLLKNLNKNLQSEIIAAKRSNNNDESKYLEQTMKISSYNEKIMKMNSEKGQIQEKLRQEQVNTSEKVRIISQHQKEINKLRSKESEFLEKIKQLQSKLSRYERSLKQQNKDSQSLNVVIQRLKMKQEQIVEQLQAEFKKKQAIFEGVRKRLHTEKALLQEKCDLLYQKFSNLEKEKINLEEQLQKLEQQLKLMKQRGYLQVDLQKESQLPLSEECIQQQHKQQQNNSENPKRQKISLSELLQKMKDLQHLNGQLNERLNTQLSTHVNKQVLKNLFANYDDQSKEWSIRRNVKNQIYMMLDMKDKLPKIEEEVKGSKWFGIF